MRRMALVLGAGALVTGIAEWALSGNLARNDANVAWTLAAAFAVCAAAEAVRGSSRSEVRTWTSVAVAAGAWLAGQAAWNWYTASSTSVPVPSIADVMWLAFPLIAAIGIYRFAEVPAPVRRVIDLDAFALAVGAGALTMTLNWHAFQASPLSIGGRATTLAYPTLYAALVAIAVGGIVGAPEVLRRRDLMLVFAGLLCESVGFALWCPEVLSGTFVQGSSYLDSFWTLGLLLIGAGALTRHPDPQQIFYGHDRLRRRTLLPAVAFVGLAIALLLLGHQGAAFDQRLPVLVAICIVGTVLLVRGWFAFAAVEELEAARRATLARRNRELEAFAYSASHDLKAPLVSISGFAGMLERSLAGRLGADEAYYLRRIDANARGLQDLISDLFAFARSGDDERAAEPVDATALAAELVAELGDRAAARGMALVVDGQLPTVRAHPVRLKQALTNLVDNSLRYGAGDVRVSGRDGKGVAEIVVEDGGTGVPSGERDRIFDVFARGERARRTSPDGTGLGLALVKRIVESSGGDVRYEDGSGARFVLTFPEVAR